MKPSIIAKNVWNHAIELQDKIDKGLVAKQSVMYHYFGLLSMYAAAQIAIETNDEEWLDTIIEMQKMYPYEFESKRCYFHYNFDNYRVGGITKAWLCMKGYFQDHLDVLKEYADMTMDAPKSFDGILCHPRYYPQEERIWIDTIYAALPYMFFAGIALKEDKYIDFALDQCFKLYDVFLDKSNGLLHQARGFMGDKMTITEDHWGRGNGWGYIGLSEIVRYLPQEHPRYAEAVERFVAHSEALIKYQDHRGLWRQSLAEPLAWEESSGSALILYGLGIGMRKGILDKDVYMPVFKKGLEGLVQYCIGVDFSVDRCCHGCLAPGDTPERKGKLEAYLVDVRPELDNGHAFGPVLLALSEAEKNGIHNIIWK